MALPLRNIPFLPLSSQSDCNELLLITTLLDYGAEGNFLDITLAINSRFVLFPSPHPISVNALDGQALPFVTHSTGLVSLTTSGNHTEEIDIMLIDSPLAPVVLGHPWFTLHNPHINWHQSSDHCHAFCLVSA